jgi:uncharacterized protein
MKGLHITALVLVIIGAINWGLVGLFNFDLVAAIFGGAMAPMSRIIYIIVGIAGIVIIFTSAVLETGGEHSRRAAG